jgi:hypothetical protein
MTEPFTLEPEREAILTFTGEELRELKLNKPGPSGQMGGYQQLENWIIQNTDPQTGRCHFTSNRLERLIRYCKNYGSGGPNDRLRRACIPALRRHGLFP